MVQQIPPSAVLVGSGDPLSGPYYLVISGLPEFTKWQDLADLLRYKICPRLDVYISLNGPNNTSGWIRVMGLEIFAHAERVLRECTFKGHQITHHDPGYNYTHGFGAILIHEPFEKDKHLLLSSEILSSVPRPSPIVAAGDPFWVWPQALPPPPVVQYPLTPSSPSHSAPWDFTPWRYAQGMPHQMPPHLQPTQYVYPQTQTQPDHISTLPSTQAPPTPPWFCGSPLAERNQYHQTWPHVQVHAHAQEAGLKLILSWKDPCYPVYHHPSPHPGAPMYPWVPTSPTTITGHRRSHTQNAYSEKRLCTITRGALSWLKNDGWNLECSPDMAIVTFPTQQHTLQAFHELTMRLEYIAIRFPYSEEELAILENSPMIKPCTHWYHRDLQGQGHKQQRHNNSHTKEAKYQSPVLLPAPNLNPPGRRERTKPQTSRLFTGRYNPPSKEYPMKQAETSYNKRQSPTKSPGVLIVDGTSRRQDEKDNPGLAVGLGLGTKAQSPFTGDTTDKTQVVVVNGSSRDITRQSTGFLRS